MSSDGGMLTLDTAALHTKWVRDIYDEQARNIGAGLGAVAGAVIGNNVGGGNAATGALIGGIVVVDAAHVDLVVTKPLADEDACAVAVRPIFPQVAEFPNRHPKPT